MKRGRVLTPKQMERVRDHRYVVEGRTLLDPIMQVLWCRLFSMIPPRINCNVITMVGLALNMTSFTILMCYSPTATDEVPLWACALASVTMFLYQICDALDGKQCLRGLANKKDWHIAEIVDHASDSVSTVFVTIQLAICMRIGERPELFLTLMLTAMFMFFTAHWQTYISGVVRFGTLDVTESELALCFGYLLTAIIGQQFWAQKVYGVEWREAVVISSAVMAVIKLVNHAIFIWRRGYRLTVAGTSVFSPFLSIAMVFVLAIITKEMTDLCDYQPCIFFIVFGLLEAKMSNKLMVAYMTKSKFTPMDSIFLGPLVLLANQLLNNPLSSHLLLWAVVVYTAADLFYYIRIVVLDICDLLHLTFFSAYVIKEPAHGDVINGSSGKRNVDANKN
ncbi:cholinephosphotransferase 1-like isoform X2 [Patiria miniata]|nr:cholinephosphotransferase 1-like isoform X2 [Patiria miniata]XP_038071006.1 cholinephosphotransferase 1-like isoform X2 [Patiria miniata]